MLSNVQIGLFITGGIAAYKSAELARAFIKAGAQVRVAMTQSAQEFITPLTLQTLTKDRVLVDTFAEDDPDCVQHIELADWLDIAVIAPATANMIGKLANGIGDEIVSTTLLAVDQPRLLVPAMNTKMWENPATQSNLEKLRQYGYGVMEPATGFLAEGYEGKGRLPEIEEIVRVTELHYAQHVLPQHLQGKKVVVSAGGTAEAIDPVRYISNRSSGRMGYAMATAAQFFGAEVSIVSTRPDLPVPPHSEVKYVETAKEMMSVLEREYDIADYIVMTAAVSDFRVQNPAKEKIKKQGIAKGKLTIELAENPDIIASLAKKRRDQILIGFAAETQNLVEYAQKKLRDKDMDWIIANDVSQVGIGFNAEHNEAIVIGKDGTYEELPMQTKLDLARLIWEVILDPNVGPRE